MRGLLPTRLILGGGAQSATGSPKVRHTRTFKPGGDTAEFVYPIVPGLVQDNTHIIFADGITNYKMSMVSKEWNRYCKLVVDMKCCNDPVFVSFSLMDEVRKLNILWILKYIELFDKQTLTESVFETGNKLLVDIIVRTGNKSSWNDGYYGACCGNHIELARWTLSKGARRNERGFEAACYRGHTELALTFPPYSGAWSCGLYGACKSGNKRIVDEVISWGEYNWDLGLKGACESGNMEIAQLMISRGANDWHSGLLVACRFGHIPAAQLMMANGANNFDDAFVTACYSKNIELVQLMITVTAFSTVWEEGFVAACSGGVNMVKFMLNKCDNKWDLGLTMAYLNGDLELVKFLVANGATNNFANLQPHPQNAILHQFLVANIFDEYLHPHQQNAMHIIKFLKSIGYQCECNQCKLYGI